MQSLTVFYFRDVLKSFEEEQDTPLLPFVPILLKDIYFWNEGNDDNLQSMINFDKLRMLTKHVMVGCYFPHIGIFTISTFCLTLPLACKRLSSIPQDLKARNEIPFEEEADVGLQAYNGVTAVRKHMHK